MVGFILKIHFMKLIYLLITCLLNLSCIAQVSLLEYDVFSNGRKDGETYIVFNELVSISGLPEEINNMKNSIFVKNFKIFVLITSHNIHLFGKEAIISQAGLGKQVPPAF